MKTAIIREIDKFNCIFCSYIRIVFKIELHLQETGGNIFLEAMGVTIPIMEVMEDTDLITMVVTIQVGMVEMGDIIQEAMEIKTGDFTPITTIMEETMEDTFQEVMVMTGDTIQEEMVEMGVTTQETMEEMVDIGPVVEDKLQ